MSDYTKVIAALEALEAAVKNVDAREAAAKQTVKLPLPGSMPPELRVTACWRCGDSDSDVVSLVGGYISRLCLTCRCDWARLCNQPGEIGQAYGDRMVAGIEVEGYDRSSNDSAYLANRLILADRTLFELADAWVNNRGGESKP